MDKLGLEMACLVHIRRRQAIAHLNLFLCTRWVEVLKHGTDHVHDLLVGSRVANNDVVAHPSQLEKVSHALAVLL